MIDLKPYFQDCFYKKHLGIDCPGCGFQRSFEHLVNGNVKESFAMYPPLIPILLMILFVAAHLKFDFKWGHKVIMYMFICNVALIVVNYILKFV